MIGTNPVGVLADDSKAITYKADNKTYLRQLACMALNVVHETAHTLGMPDVYNNAGHDVGGTECLMERFDESTAYAFYQDVLHGAEDPFCSSCMQSMRTYTNNISIPGN